MWLYWSKFTEETLNGKLHFLCSGKAVSWFYYIISKYRDMENNYQYLRDIKLNDYGIKSELPVHVILDIIDYTKLREQGRIGIGLSG